VNLCDSRAIGCSYFGAREATMPGEECFGGIDCETGSGYCGAPIEAEVTVCRRQSGNHRHNIS
jgi:hypothetical protein